MWQYDLDIINSLSIHLNNPTLFLSQCNDTYIYEEVKRLFLDTVYNEIYNLYISGDYHKINTYTVRHNKFGNVSLAHFDKANNNDLYKVPHHYEIPRKPLKTDFKYNFIAPMRTDISFNDYMNIRKIDLNFDNVAQKIFHKNDKLRQRPIRIYAEYKHFIDDKYEEECRIEKNKLDFMYNIDLEKWNYKIKDYVSKYVNRAELIFYIYKYGSDVEHQQGSRLYDFKQQIIDDKFVKVKSYTEYANEIGERIYNTDGNLAYIIWYIKETKKTMKRRINNNKFLIMCLLGIVLFIKYKKNITFDILLNLLDKIKKTAKIWKSQANKYRYFNY